MTADLRQSKKKNRFAVSKTWWTRHILNKKTKYVLLVSIFFLVMKKKMFTLKKLYIIGYKVGK